MGMKQDSIKYLVCGLDCTFFAPKTNNFEEVINKALKLVSQIYVVNNQENYEIERDFEYLDSFDGEVDSEPKVVISEFLKHGMERNDEKKAEILKNLLAFQVKRERLEKNSVEIKLFESSFLRVGLEYYFEDCTFKIQAEASQQTEGEADEALSWVWMSINKVFLGEQIELELMLKDRENLKKKKRYVEVLELSENPVFAFCLDEV